MSALRWVIFDQFSLAVQTTPNILLIQSHSQFGPQLNWLIIMVLLLTMALKIKFTYDICYT